MRAEKIFVENEILELKKSTSELKEAICSIVAMINKHGGGELYFGIRNDGTVIGQDVNEKTLRDISIAISNHIEPKIFPIIDRVVIEDKVCVYVKFDGADIPYYAYGRSYIRVSDTDKKITAKELENMILIKNKNAMVWDREETNKSFDIVDEMSLRKFIKSANSAGRINFEFTNKATVLTKLKLISSNNILLNAGDLLFASDSDLEVQMATFAGVEKLTFIDIKRDEGRIFDLLQSMEDYIKQRINWNVKFGNLERIEEPEIPIKALREALVNSLCHRDYRNPKPNEIAIFKNRIEIYNPGSFPENLTPNDFIKGRERSVLRNPLIARILYYCKEIEEWGSGLKRINDECSNNNVKVEFTVLKTGFLTTFYRLMNVNNNNIISHKQLLELRERENLGDKTKNLGDKRENLGNKTESKLLHLIKQDSSITTVLLAEQLGLSVKTIEWQIKKLISKNILQRMGSRKTGYWKIIDK